MHWMCSIPLAVLSMLVACSSAIAKQASDQESLFENHVRPVLVQRCIKCHGPSKSESGLRLDTLSHLLKGGDSGAAIDRSDAAASLLSQVLDWKHDVKMPPDKPLDAVAIDAINRWIAAGAHWPDQVKLSSGPELRSGPPTADELKFWSLQPLQDSPPPINAEAGSNTAPSQSRIIDQFIQAKLKEHSLPSNPPADRRTLIRRLSYDLTGLPPTVEEIQSFIADQSPDAYDKLVERLLSSKSYGERWGRHWLDVVRYSDTAGETADYPVPDAWKYRNYVIDAFDKDKPYDQFLQEQIAGDILARKATTPEDFAEKTIATGYIAIARRFGFDSENYHHLTIQDTIDTLGQTALGISIGCARCHDHKFDPISMEDYYALYGVFESTLYPLAGSEQKQKVRSLVPLTNLSDPQAYAQKTKETAAQFATLKSLGRNAPAVVLRSLTELDGDLELQSPAAGGSLGVLVAPWLYEGLVSVTNAAQSPFANNIPAGKVGISLPTGKAVCRIWQALNHRETDLKNRSLTLSFDFRVAKADATDGYRVALTNEQGQPNLQFILSSSAVQLHVGSKVESLATIQPGKWYQFDATFNAKQQSLQGSIAELNATPQAFEVNKIELESSIAQQLLVGSTNEPTSEYPGVEIDNLAVVPLSSNGLVESEKGSAELTQRFDDPAPFREELKRLVGIDGDFELQQDDQPPSSPWGPGPNSVVKVSKLAQSPLVKLVDKGEHGIRMPNRAEYDGFGMQLDRLQPDSEGIIGSYFEFCCTSQEQGGQGSWRYYLGHGPGNSAAIELFFNGSQFYRRSGDARESIAELQIGRWNQVLLELDTKNRTYRGWLIAGENKVEFSGAVAAGWDGIVDYTFIDSYGHIGGVRPALDADNFALIYGNEASKVESVTAIDPANVSHEVLQRTLQRILSGRVDRGARSERVNELRTKLATLQSVGDKIEKQLLEPVQGMAYAVAEGTPHDVPIHMRGEPSQPGKLVNRRLPALFASKDVEADKFDGSGRLPLARWITNEASPLTARVMVNRIWQQHFGRGIVRTENDFGTRGEAPTHPELLDWLASRFIESGWSVKHMHRLIVHSQAYQQSSSPAQHADNTSRHALASGSEDQTAGSTAPDQIDPENRYLWRFSPRRLSAEEIRDSMLLASDSLDPSPGAEHPFPAPHTWGFSQHAPFYAVYETNRRSVYLMQQRIKRHPFLALFDGSDPNVSTARRELTTVPTQALYLMNNPFVHQSASSLAKRFGSIQNERDRAAAMIYCCLGREASADQIDRAMAFVNSYANSLASIADNSQSQNSQAQNPQSEAWTAFARTLLTRNEFLFVE